MDTDYGIDERYFTAIGKVCVAYQRLEEHLGLLAYCLLGIDRRAAQCVTAEQSFRNLKSLVANLLALKVEERGELRPGIRESLKHCLDVAQKACDERNRVIHSQIGFPSFDPESDVWPIAMLEKVSAKEKGLKATTIAESPEEIEAVAARVVVADQLLIEFCRDFVTSYNVPQPARVPVPMPVPEPVYTVADFATDAAEDLTATPSFADCWEYVELLGIAKRHLDSLDAKRIHDHADNFAALKSSTVFAAIAIEAAVNDFILTHWLFVEGHYLKAAMKPMVENFIWRKTPEKIAFVVENWGEAKFPDALMKDVARLVTIRNQITHQKGIKLVIDGAVDRSTITKVSPVTRDDMQHMKRHYEIARDFLKCFWLPGNRELSRVPQPKAKST